MKVTIFGAGYVGLVTGACLAEVGNHVVFVDVDADRVAALSAGECPIHEPGLPEMITRNLEAGRLSFTTDAAVGVEFGLLQFIAVGTPSDEDGAADLKYVLDVGRTIGSHLEDYRLVVLKSTVPVGTSEKMRDVINSDKPFDVASNPEFLREGAAIEDFMNSDRIVIGTDSEKAEQLLRALYAPFNRNQDRLITMNIPSSELTKYAANAMLATKISFMNEMSHIADIYGADIDHIRVGIGSDPRIGYHFINPGCGYGGSCFPKDVRALKRMAEEHNFDATLINSVELVNQRQKDVLFNKINKHFSGNLSGRVFALWGLSFKPNTDDMREASSLVLMEKLWAAGARVQAYDPAASETAQKIIGGRSDFHFCDEPNQAFEGADALVVVTEWSEFLSPDFDLIKSSLSEPVIFDGRNIYDPVYLSSIGITYYAIGRGVRS